jgi:hypothetical protein
MDRSGRHVRSRVWRVGSWAAFAIGAIGAIGAAAGSSGAQPQTTSTREPRRLTVAILGTGLTAPDARTTGVTLDARLQQEIDSANLPFTVSATGRYGESSTEALRHLDSLVGHSMDVFVLETGSTDATKGLGADSTRSIIRVILHRVRATHPESWVCLVREVPSLALPAADTAAFRSLYGSLGRSERATMLPTAADSLWPQLEPVLRKVASLRLGAG